MLLTKQVYERGLLSGCSKRGALGPWEVSLNMALSAAMGQVGNLDVAAMVMVMPLWKGSVFNAGSMMCVCVALLKLGRNVMQPLERLRLELNLPVFPIVNSPLQRRPV